MPRGTCPVCGRSKWLFGGLLGLHQNLALEVCAGSGGPPWTPPENSGGGR